MTDSMIANKVASAGSQSQTNRLDNISSQLNNAKDTQKAKETAQEFEAVFLSQVLKNMYQDVEPDELFGGGSSEEMFRSMMLDEYGKLLSKGNSGISIADNVQREILKLQEVQ
jgi:Rod binding domain-containing protein